MSQVSNKITQKRFTGFLQTPTLWAHKKINGISQFDLEKHTFKLTSDFDENLRLGKYVEQFVFEVLSKDSSISFLKSNIQIQKGKQTLGEIDCLLIRNEKPIHLEVSYKFYVVDFSRGGNEIDYCVGPNNRDSLIEKLERLQNHQLPLLFKEDTQSYLDGFNVNECEQQVLFKGQLYLPWNQKEYRLSILNQDCIAGFYITSKEFLLFKNDKFFIPNKKDWLIRPYSEVSWLNFEQIQVEIKHFHSKNYSPMCWIKKRNGELLKVFVIWWK